MAKQAAVWGIDIGQSALKALRCRRNPENESQIVAEAFDLIEYPAILSQGDVDPEALIHDALTEFLSRNKIRNERVVISVSGQNGLARFIKLPPVETSKIPDIVKYEARQQIPFSLDEVVWDYQTMSGGGGTDGFALETEVGLFAMKRDQVQRALAPFNKVDVEVDIVQLTPLALYNLVVFDQMQSLPADEEYDPENPPDSVVVLSLGTDTTDLVVTNGFRVWQRSIPVGGNHFTRALVKELKMSFGSAEHLKRNASQAEDPKAIFQAMRPVFNDLLTEVQRSIGYFKNMDRRANVSRVIALGNVMKLPGLQRYLTQNLGYELTKPEKYRGLIGSDVVDAPAFKENMLAYGVCYGLALQGLGNSRIHTSLLPPEIKRDRLIRSKKPWAVAAAAAVLLGCSVSFFGGFDRLQSVSLDPSPEANSFEAPTSFYQLNMKARSLASDADQQRNDFEEARRKLTKTDEVGRSLLQNVLGRDRMLSFLRAVNLCLPRMPALSDTELEAARGKSDAERVATRREIKIDAIECLWVPKLENWYNDVRQWDTLDAAAAAAAAPQLDPNDPTAIPGGAAGGTGGSTDGGPRGPGWVFALKGHHYYNADPREQGLQFVRNTLLTNLKQDEMPLPPELASGGLTMYPVKKLGIQYPVIVGQPLIDQNFPFPLDDAPAAAPAPGGLRMPGMGPGAAVPTRPQPRFDFTLQFCWQPLNEGLQGAPAVEQTEEPADSQ